MALRLDIYGCDGRKNQSLTDVEVVDGLKTMRTTWPHPFTDIAINRIEELIIEKELWREECVMLLVALKKVLKHHEHIEREHTWHLEANAQVGLRQLLRDVGEVIARAEGREVAHG